MRNGATDGSGRRRILSLVTLFLFFSGLCALVYQTVWMREFRLVFGSSTAASAAALAIFMGGLGAGSLLFGRRRISNPLGIYGWLEVTIALSAAISPLAIALIRGIYLAVGGSSTLGTAGASIVRLLLAALVLAIPTLCMGGTLPTIIRRVESEADRGRSVVALVYGANTIGAVAGVLLTTFYSLEHLGNRYTIWLAALVNLLIGLAAVQMSLSDRPSEDEEIEDSARPASAPLRFVLGAAFAVGTAFFLMEIVWYRMLIPLLGGTTFTFGLILAVALLGIGVGSALYAATFARRTATLTVLAWTCALEALFLAIPFALGDRVALFALLLRPLGGFGFAGLVASWVIVCLVVVFPAAMTAGFQFPVLVSLLGEGSEKVGRHVGYAYAWNTVGAIVGAVAGGFGLLPLLGALGVWKLAVALLVIVSVIAAFLRLRSTASWVAVLVSAAAVAMLFPLGPTAMWRQTPIGFGRVDQSTPAENVLKNFINYRRRTVEWQKDGVESSIALANEDGYAFLVNGKVDGHTRLDAGTQVMGGILGAMLHPDPKNACVVGLGTGASAGWLAVVPSIERVDVIELEPSVLHVAEVSAVANRDVLKNPKVKITIGDAREVLQTTRQKYDVIFSEPSNPARAGVASLFTQNFYRSVDKRLTERGIFVQWLQAYEVDAETIRTVYATLTSVFPYVDTWQTTKGDLLLVSSRKPMAMDLDEMRAKITRQPYYDALADGWKVSDIAGFVAHFTAGNATAKWLAEDSRLNTDDRTLIEYSFARTLGKSLFNVDELWVHAKLRRDDRPLLRSGAIDWKAVEARQIAMRTVENAQPFVHPLMPPQLRARAAAHSAYLDGDYGRAIRSWVSQPDEPLEAIDLLTFVESVSAGGDEKAMLMIDELPPLLRPIEQDVLRASLRVQQQKLPEAAEFLARAFTAYRENPWPLVLSMNRALDLAAIVASNDATKQSAQKMHESLSQPFALKMLNERRLDTLLATARIIDGGECGEKTMAALQMREPWVPWVKDFLVLRYRCHSANNTALAAEARRDLEEFLAAEKTPLDRKTPLGAPVKVGR